MKICVVTGSSGLVGSESVKFYCNKGYTVVGIDNNIHNYFFGTSTSIIKDHLANTYKDQYIRHSVDIRDRIPLEEIFKHYNTKINCIIHCAYHPLHDWVTKEPHTTIGIGAIGTLNLLEAARAYCPKASFICMSTNKVYGDNPNKLDIVEKDMRYDVASNGIDETMSIDNCTYSIFGLSKLSEDSIVYEYGRYFGMNTVVFRGGPITGTNYPYEQNHRSLSYIVKCIVENSNYIINGYKGKQVSDTIHIYDLVNAFWNYHTNPKPAAIYNIGGGRENSLSILEIIQKVNSMTGKEYRDYEYVTETQSDDTMWYITNYSKFAKGYPNWKIQYPIDRILRDILCNMSKHTLTAHIMGGLGNQLFIIATTYSVSRQLNMNLKFELNQFLGCGQGSHPSNYYDSLYAKLQFVNNIPWHNTLYEKSWCHYNVGEDVKHIIQHSHSTSVTLSGYYQSEMNFKDYAAEVRELFTPALGMIGYLETHSDIFARFPELKHDHDFAFIGVRRGDYLNNPHIHNPCGMTYYTMAMEKMGKERYYIATDDVEWVKTHFIGDKFRYFDIKNDLHQLIAATLFKSYIISNSSFYWWGSFLSIYDSPRIIAPDKWITFNGEGHKESYWSIYRDVMEVLERPIETD